MSRACGQSRWEEEATLAQKEQENALRLWVGDDKGH